MDQEPMIPFTAENNKKVQQPHPWTSQRTKNYPNSLLRFHNQLIEFTQYVSPIKAEHINKKCAAERIQKQIKQIVPNGQLINPLFTNRIYLQDTELELFLIVPELKAEIPQNLISKLEGYKYVRLYQYLDSRKAEDYKVVCYDKEILTQIWIIIVDQSWRPFIEDAEDIINSSPQIKYLTMVNMCMIRQRGFHLMIKNLLVFGICAYFLFQRRKQRVRTLTEHFIKFLEYFGSGTTSEKKIVYKGKNIFESSLTQEQRLFSFQINEGVDLSVNILRDYFKLLQNRYRVMGNYSYEPGKSIVTHLVNPSEGEFSYL